MTTILPEKHVRTSESLIGLGGVILTLLDEKPRTLDMIWRGLTQQNLVSYRLHGSISLDSAVLALDFLYAIGAVHLTSEGMIEHATR